MIQRLVKLSFRADATAKFEQIFLESKDVIRAFPGCLHMEGWRDLGDPTIFYTYSRWRDEKALNDYRSSNYFGSVWPRTKALFAAKPEVVSATKLNELRPPTADILRLVVADYHIDFGSISAAHFAWLSEQQYAGWIVIDDENTHLDCLPHIQLFLPDNCPVITVAPGELHKHLGTLQHIWEKMFAAGVGRRWCAIVLGGGVVGDMGGFAAATYKRGIDIIQVPTTLLSQVDSSVGGKLGIDFLNVKNSIGTFQNPQVVWIDPAFLATLPAREIRSGYAEILKHALIADVDQWRRLRKIRDLKTASWLDIIPPSVEIKRRIVEEDPFERGLRKALNFGHTIGHAIESYWLETNQRLLHGEAIAAGMIMEAWLSTQLGALQEESLWEITDYFLAIYGHQLVPPESFDQLLRLMQQDKKNEDDRINFTLLDQIGKAKINATATAEEILGALQYYNRLGA